MAEARRGEHGMWAPMSMVDHSGLLNLRPALRQGHQW